MVFRRLRQEGRPGAPRKVAMRYNFRRTPNHVKWEFDLSISLFLPFSYSQTQNMIERGFLRNQLSRIHAEKIIQLGLDLLPVSTAKNLWIVMKTEATGLRTF